jgi:hypothetical protein
MFMNRDANHLPPKHNPRGFFVKLRRLSASYMNVDCVTLCKGEKCI